MLSKNCLGLLLASVLVSFAASAEAEWVLISKVDAVDKFYIDDAGISRNGNFPKAVLKAKFASAKTIKGKQFDEAVWDADFQCDQQKYRGGDEQWFLNGAPVGGFKRPLLAAPFAPFKEVTKNSVQEVALKLSCGVLDVSKFRLFMQQQISASQSRMETPSDANTVVATPKTAESEKFELKEPSRPAPEVVSEPERLRRSIGIEKIVWLKRDTQETPTSLDAAQTTYETVATIDKGTLSLTGTTLIVLGTGQIRRAILDKAQVSSTLLVGQRQVPNPKYQQAILDYQNALSSNAQTQFRNSLSGQPANGWAAFGRALEELGTAGAVDAARNNLANTPATISEDVTQQYSFQTNKINSKKDVQLRFILIDSKNRSLKSLDYAPIEESKQFSIAYNIDSRDTRLADLNKSFDSEGDVDKWEAQPVRLDATELLRFIEGHLSQAKNVSYKRSDDPIKVAGLNSVPAKQANSVSQGAFQSGEDPRFESIVVVTNPSGMGTGFFVATDLVLTNEHVISGSQFAEIKFHDGKQSFGKVVKKDIAKDLALVRVADKGRPLTLVDAHISVGDTVDVIGHPKGLTYSLSRGVVSAIRTMKPPGVAGAGLVKYIQTDAVINSGNSGGPMLIKDKVVGVNTQKLVAKGVEGIGFAVHMDEIRAFLKD